MGQFAPVVVQYVIDNFDNLADLAMKFITNRQQQSILTDLKTNLDTISYELEHVKIFVADVQHAYNCAVQWPNLRKFLYGHGLVLKDDLKKYVDDLPEEDVNTSCSELFNDRKITSLEAMYGSATVMMNLPEEKQSLYEKCVNSTFFKPSKKIMCDRENWKDTALCKKPSKELVNSFKPAGKRLEKQAVTNIELKQNYDIKTKMESFGVGSTNSVGGKALENNSQTDNADLQNKFSEDNKKKADGFTQTATSIRWDKLYDGTCVETQRVEAQFESKESCKNDTNRDDLMFEYQYDKGWENGFWELHKKHNDCEDKLTNNQKENTDLQNKLSEELLIKREQADLKKAAGFTRAAASIRWDKLYDGTCVETQRVEAQFESVESCKNDTKQADEFRNMFEDFELGPAFKTPNAAYSALRSAIDNLHREWGERFVDLERLLEDCDELDNELTESKETSHNQNIDNVKLQQKLEQVTRKYEMEMFVKKNHTEDGVSLMDNPERTKEMVEHDATIVTVGNITPATRKKLLQRIIVGCLYLGAYFAQKAITDTSMPHQLASSGLDSMGMYLR